jgi:hypothetical protein
MTVEKTPVESDAMLEEAKSGSGVRWYFKSVQSSPGAFTTEPSYKEFTDDIDQAIDVETSDETRYQPMMETDYPTHLGLELYPGQSAWVQIEVEYPADELMDPMYFAVQATSLGEDIKSHNNRANMTLEIKYSDLTFDMGITSTNSGIEIYGQRSENNPQLNIRIKMRNIGEIDARDIEIALYVDGQFLDSRTVMRLVNSSEGNYKDILISFAWKPIAGKHKIEVKIDPDNSIVESNEKNNVVSEEVSISSASLASEFFGNKATCPIIFVILAAAIIGITTYYILRKRKDEIE